MKVRVQFKWYDMWVGAYIERLANTPLRIYICPLPMVVIRLEFA